MSSNVDIASLFSDDGLKGFSDPFLTPSNHFVPKNLDTALDFSLFLYHSNPKYRRASIRVVSHFVTELDIKSRGSENDMSAQTRTEVKDLLRDGLGIRTHLQTMGQEWSVFGNSFWRIHYPYDRYLIDNRNGDARWYALSGFPESLVKFHLGKMQYEVPDPRKLTKGVSGGTAFFDFIDIADKDMSKIRLRSLDPREVFILYSEVSGRCQYVYQFGQDLITDTKKGILHQVNETPRSMLEAMSKDQYFKFEDDQLFHFKAPTIAGLQSKGWGIPEPFLLYRSLHQVQVYRRIDEYVGLDYMLPFRLFSPKLDQGMSATEVYNNLGQWQGQVKKMIDNRRDNPTKMMAFPFPINYQEFGAEGKNLVPKELIQYQDDSTLDDAGYPAELFRASLQIQQVPTAVRLFESSFGFIPDGYSRFVQWVSNRVLDYGGQQRVSASVTRPSLADDLEKRGIYLQLAATGEISRRLGFQGLGIDDPVSQKAERLDEDMEVAKITQEKEEAAQREMQGSLTDQMAAAEQEAAAAGGAPAAAGGQGMAMDINSLIGPDVAQLDPSQLQDRGAQIAQAAVGLAPGESARILRQIEASNKNLHAVVKEQMAKIRSQAESQGRAQLRGQG